MLCLTKWRFNEAQHLYKQNQKKNEGMKIENKKGKWLVNGNAYESMTPTEKEVLNAYFKGLKIEKSCL